MFRQQELCKKLSQASERIDEERYDTEAKVLKADKEVLMGYILRISVETKKPLTAMCSLTPRINVHHAGLPLWTRARLPFFRGLGF